MPRQLYVLCYQLAYRQEAAFPYGINYYSYGARRHTYNESGAITHVDRHATPEFKRGS